MAHSTRRVLALTVAAFGSLSLVACGGGFEEPTTGQSSSATGATSGSAGGVPSGQTLRMLIASSGDAETNAVKEAAAAWGAATGNENAHSAVPAFGSVLLGRSNRASRKLNR